MPDESPSNPFNHHSGPRIGVDLGGTKTEIVVLDGDQTRLRRRIDTPAQDYAQILDTIATLVAAAEQELGSARLPVGIGVPGALSPTSGLLRNSNTQCLNGRPLRRDLEARLGRAVAMENDANCLVLSEALIGAGRGYSVVFGVIVGTGTGGGIVVDGRVLRGPNAIAGEWGHNPLPWRSEADGNPACYCGKYGCIETFLSGPGLARGFADAYSRSLSSHEIFAAAAAGDVDARAMRERWLDQFARALAQVINLLDPDVVVLGGGLSNQAALYRELPDRLPQYVFADAVLTPVLPAEHGDSSGVFGAAMLPSPTDAPDTGSGR